jgi:hypothetical protein
MKKLALFISFLLVISCTKDPIIYTLTTSANPAEGGTVSPSTQQYDEGETASITATPSSEYVFQSWSGATGSTNSTSVVMNSDKSVTANFVKKKYSLNVMVEGEGTVSEKVIKAGVATDYNSGTVVELTAVPSGEWLFVEWKGDVTGTENPTQITIDKAKNVTAVFVKKQYPLTIEIEGEGTVTEKVIKAGVATDYNSGTIVELTAEPTGDWEFVEWTGDLTSTENPVQITIDGPKTVKVKFNEIQDYILKRYDLEISNKLGVNETMNNVQLNFHLNREGQEYFVFGSKGYETVILRKNNEEWKEFLVDDFRIHGGRNYRIIDNSSFLIGGTGETSYIPYDQWIDHIYIQNINGNILQTKKVSTNKGYHHGVAIGDISGNGLNDVISNAGIFLQNDNHDFEEYDFLNKNYNSFIIDPKRIKELGNPIEPKIYDLYKDGRKEILMGFVDDADVNRGQILIYEYSNQTNRYELVQEIYNDVDFGKQVNSMQISDFNGDGINDIAILRWGKTFDDGSMMLDVWLGNTDKSFSKSFEIFYPNNEIQSAQFKISDLNGDGFDDIIFIPFGGTVDEFNTWRYHKADELNNGVYIDELVLLNDGTGRFEKTNNKLIVKDLGDFNYLIPFIRNSNLIYFGLKGQVDGEFFKAKLFEIEINSRFWK